MRKDWKLMKIEFKDSEIQINKENKDFFIESKLMIDGEYQGFIDISHDEEYKDMNFGGSFDSDDDDFLEFIENEYKNHIIRSFIQGKLIIDQLIYLRIKEIIKRRNELDNMRLIPYKKKSREKLKELEKIQGLSGDDHNKEIKKIQFKYFHGNYQFSKKILKEREKINKEKKFLLMKIHSLIDLSIGSIKINHDQGKLRIESLPHEYGG
jgi:hypothetical protein